MIFFIVLVSQQLQSDGSISLLYTQFGVTESIPKRVNSNPRLTVLWIPLVNQLTNSARSKKHFKTVDRLCVSKSKFVQSNGCKKFQMYRFSQILQKWDSFWIFQFDWIQQKSDNNKIAQVLYVEKRLGNPDEFSTIKQMQDKLDKENTEDTHTRVHVLVADWIIDDSEQTLSRCHTHWMHDGHLSTNKDWDWQPFNMKEWLERSHDYSIICEENVPTQVLLWSDAMLKIQRHFEQDNIKDLHFHPRQEFDARSQHLALGCNVMYFLLHLDGIAMYHLLTMNQQHITVGFVLINLTINAKSSIHYYRVSIIPKGKEWSIDLIFSLIDKEIKSWQKGFPMQSDHDPNKFVMVYPTLFGMLADGEEIVELIGKRSLKSISGSLFLKECIALNPNPIGGPSSACFISRRFLTNSVCVLLRKPRYIVFSSFVILIEYYIFT